jgi:hypothetical protein
LLAYLVKLPSQEEVLMTCSALRLYESSLYPAKIVSTPTYTREGDRILTLLDLVGARDGGE